MNMDALIAIADGIVGRAGAAFSFRYNPAEDESVDAELELMEAGKPCRREIEGEAVGYAIQLCMVGGGYSANCYYYDGDGELDGVADIYSGNNIRAAAHAIGARLAGLIA